jgi:hypothetical protein
VRRHRALLLQQPGEIRLPEKTFEMRSARPLEIAAFAGILLAGGFLFVWMIVLSDAVPAEYRSASPGFGWSWDFDYEAAMRDAGRLGAAPWPWPARNTGNRLLLPRNQPLVYEGLAITYRGMIKSDGFRLDVVIQSLDSGVTYPRDVSVMEARRGFTIADGHFTLEQITPRYLRLRAAGQ